MTKIDFKKELKHLYRPSAKKMAIVDVQPLQFLMIDGQGDPNTSQAYAEALETLYAVAYTLKFMSKKELERDYVVMPLEGLWWVEDMIEFSVENKDDWLWTAMIMQPDWISEEMVGAAKEAAAKKKDLPALPKLRFGAYHEGLAVQIMHIGSYADEGPTIARLHAFIAENGYQPAGKHHEVYLSDPRRTAPDKLKIVIRQPMKKVN
jgi:hypothetical protein